MKDRTETVHASTNGTIPDSTARVLGRFSASHPRGSRPAEEFAAAQRLAGISATVVMNLDEDAFLVTEVTV